MSDYTTLSFFNKVLCRGSDVVSAMHWSVTAQGCGLSDAHCEQTIISSAIVALMMAALW